MTKILLQPNITGQLGALPSGFPPASDTQSFPSTMRGAPVCALSTPVVHVDRSAQAIMRQPVRTVPPVYQVEQTASAMSKVVTSLEERVNAIMAEDMEPTAGRAPKKPKVDQYDDKGNIPDERTVFDSKGKKHYWKNLLYSEIPKHSLAKQLGYDMGFTIRISLIPNFYKSSKYLKMKSVSTAPVHKFRIDIGGFTGGYQTKKLLDKVGAYFSSKLMSPDHKQVYPWMKVVDQGKFYICTASDMSFYRMVGGVSSEWVEKTGTMKHDKARAQEHFREMMLSKVLLGSMDSPVKMVTLGEGAEFEKQVIDIPLEFEGGAERKWIWTLYESEYAAITAIDPSKLAAAEADEENEDPPPEYEYPDATPPVVVPGFPVVTDPAFLKPGA